MAMNPKPFRRYGKIRSSAPPLGKSRSDYGKWLFAWHERRMDRLFQHQDRRRALIQANRRLHRAQRTERDWAALSCMSNRGRVLFSQQGQTALEYAYLAHHVGTIP
jgi:hypothetical protein